MQTEADFKGHTLGVWFFGNEYPFYAWMNKLGIPTEGGADGATPPDADDAVFFGAEVFAIGEAFGDFLAPGFGAIEGVVEAEAGDDEESEEESDAAGAEAMA